MCWHGRNPFISNYRMKIYCKGLNNLNRRMLKIIILYLLNYVSTCASRKLLILYINVVHIATRILLLIYFRFKCPMITEAKCEFLNFNEFIMNYKFLSTNTTS